MGIDRPEDDDVPVAATRVGDVGSESASRDVISAEAIGADREWRGEIPDEAPAVAPEFAPEFAPESASEASRHEYHVEYRAKVEAVYLADARQRWEEVMPGFAEEWRQYKGDHPVAPDVRPEIDPEARAQVERGCKEIRETEENVVTPVMARIDGEDPERGLVGLEFRCKGQDRIMEKVAVALKEQPQLNPSDALASVKDGIRYSFQYTEPHYTEGVYADIGRLKAEGCDLVDLRNSWASEEYKGINSRWRVPENGQIFEVQFHTQVSFEAKQLTHQAYERIRSPSTTQAEQDVLVDFQRRVNVCVPEPQHAREIPDFP